MLCVDPTHVWTEKLFLAYPYFILYAFGESLKKYYSTPDGDLEISTNIKDKAFLNFYRIYILIESLF
jgi:hypothetical protein